MYRSTVLRKKYLESVLLVAVGLHTNAFITVASHVGINDTEFVQKTDRV